MRNLIVKLAVSGMVCALYFGTVACGKEGTNSSADVNVASAKTVEEKGIEELTPDWELVQYTVNGKTTKADSLSNDELSAAPRFSCSDGIHIVFHNGSKDHSGTVSEENGEYIIRYDDTSSTMIASVSGDKLTIVNDKGTLEFVFEAK